MRLILDRFPQLQPDDVTSRSMGAGGTDTLLSPAAQLVFPFATECKNVEAFNVWSALEQAEAHATGKLDGLVIFKRNKTDIYCAMKFDRLLDLLMDVNAGRLL